jgi:hypothetical protein
MTLLFGFDVDPEQLLEVILEMACGIMRGFLSSEGRNHVSKRVYENTIYSPSSRLKLIS